MAKAKSVKWLICAACARPRRHSLLCRLIRGLPVGGEEHSLRMIRKIPEGKPVCKWHRVWPEGVKDGPACDAADFGTRISSTATR